MRADILTRVLFGDITIFERLYTMIVLEIVVDPMPSSLDISCRSVLIDFSGSASNFDLYALIIISLLLESTR